MADEIRHQEHGQFKEKLEAVDEMRRKMEELDGTLDIHSGAIRTLEQWRTGNGGRGAEARLQRVEDKLPEIEAGLEVVRMISDAKLEKSVHSALNARARTLPEIIKAAGSIAAMIMALALAVMAYMGSFTPRQPAPAPTEHQHVGRNP